MKMVIETTRTIFDYEKEEQKSMFNKAKSLIIEIDQEILLLRKKKKELEKLVKQEEKGL